MRALMLLFSIAGVALCVRPAGAASVRVSPVLLEAHAQSPAIGITLRNDTPKPAITQLRIFRWSQDHGADRLTPTNDVIVSPPIITLTPHTEYRARVIRLSRQSLAGEESYRLIVDELPDSKAVRDRSISFVVRQSIPVFFAPPSGNPAVAWSVVRERNSYRVTAVNHGESRMRVARLRLCDAHGLELAHRDGLVGYVLAHSQMSWTLPVPGSSAKREGLIKLSAKTEAGAIDVATALRSAR